MVEIPKNLVVWNQLASLYPRDEELVNQGCRSVETHRGRQRVIQGFGGEGMQGL